MPNRADHSPSDDLSLAVANRVLQMAPDLSLPAPRDKWIESASAPIKASQPPLPCGYGAEMNVHNLFRWIDPKYETCPFWSDKSRGAALSDAAFSLSG